MAITMRTGCTREPHPAPTAGAVDLTYAEEDRRYRWRSIGEVRLMELDGRAFDRWITREDDEPPDLQSCDGSSACRCMDCCADAALAEFGREVR
jgi:hypothetical protein